MAANSRGRFGRGGQGGHRGGRSSGGGGGRRIANGQAFIDRFFGPRILPPGSHAGLVFDRYLKIWNDDLRAPGIVQNSGKLLEQFARGFHEAGRHQLDHLKVANARRQAAIAALTGGRYRRLEFKNHETLALSLGNDHPTGNGASFDSALGAPVLAGSAIKGLIRATHSQLGMGDPEDVIRWLGPPPPEDRRGKTCQGKLIVLDALPTVWPGLAVDIINCHHGDYYIKGQPPRETESPVPVFFLTVANNLTWRFLLGGRDLSDGELDQIEEMLQTGLAWLGIGGKTAVGYGRMERKGKKKPISEYRVFDTRKVDKKGGDMTNPSGKIFISYKRERADEMRLLVEALHERGIPTWQDIHNLGAGNFVQEIKTALKDSETAGALIWLTPEVADSATVRNVEIPKLLERAEEDEAFVLQPVLAGGATREQVDEIVGFDAIKLWNTPIIDNDPATIGDVRALANRVLEERLKVIGDLREETLPLTIGVYNAGVPKQSRFDLLVDWSHCFNDDKTAKPDCWAEHIVPAVRDLRDMLSGYAGKRRIELTGLASLPSLIVLGAALSDTTDLKIVWRPPNAVDQEWSVRDDRIDPGIRSKVYERHPDSDDVAVLVDAIGGMKPDFDRSSRSLPHFRAILKIEPEREGGEFRIGSGGEAAGFAWRVRKEINQLREDNPGVRRVHLFTKVPAGLAFMIGQLLNPVGEIQLYDHGRGWDSPYRKALLINAHARDLGV